MAYGLAQVGYRDSDDLFELLPSMSNSDEGL